MYRCRVERDSIDPTGLHRLTTFVICFPRVVLAEAITHRVNYDTWGTEIAFCERTTTPEISKNSASSRAIPFSRMLQGVMDNPYMPLWTINQKGMQGGFVSDEQQLGGIKAIWLAARDEMAARAKQLAAHHVHKQDCNRLLEPWAWVTQVVTSSQWDNFFSLRCHQAAHPALRQVARMMYVARSRSTPKPLEPGQWHLPFVPQDEADSFVWIPQPTLSCAVGKMPDGSAVYGMSPVGSCIFGGDFPDIIKQSVARCAWVSYGSPDGDGSMEKVLRTWDTLVGSRPVHASPTESQATPIGEFHRHLYLRSNLSGWLQARKLLVEERVDRYTPDEGEVASWGITDPLWPEEGSLSV